MMKDTVPCPVFAGETIWNELAAFLADEKYIGSKLVVLADENTAEHCLSFILEGLKVAGEFSVIQILSGEQHKNINAVMQIWEMLCSSYAGRDSILLNLGGGVLCDMGGFAASTYKRGIKYINVPTTLLAQVDAAIGGKTGCNLGYIKNTLGTFAMPEAVFIQRKFLDTLPENHIRNGKAEMLKYGLIADRSLWNDLKKKLPLGKPDIGLISRCVTIKNNIVATDFNENGLRKILNFGHTIGHAFEAVSSDNGIMPLLHGEAVAAGMICEAYLSNKHCSLSNTELEEICDTIREVIGEIDISGLSVFQLLDRMKNDKKNVSGKIGFTLLHEIGRAAENQFIEEKDILDGISFYHQISRK